MLLSRRRHQAALEEVVRDLPEGFVALAFGDAHLVVGPTGAFALADARHADVGEAARRVTTVAREVRRRLVEAISWAPFVDPLVVSDGRVDGRHRWRAPSVRRHEPSTPGTDHASIVPPHIVQSVLASGSRQLSPADIARICAALS